MTKQKNGEGGEKRKDKDQKREAAYCYTHMVWKQRENCHVTVPWQAPSMDGTSGLTLIPYNLMDYIGT